MGRHKQMPGRTYRIVSQSSSLITVECTYLCPYCMKNATATFEAPVDRMDLLERGGFFEPLTCSSCGKISDVRFFRNNRI